LNLAIIHHLMAAFGLRSRIVLLSSLGISSQGTERIIEVCKRLGASQYLAQRPAKKYLHEAAFQDAGIEDILHPSDARLSSTLGRVHREFVRPGPALQLRPKKL